ncbi:CbtA family protein [Amycolatopsis sp. GM8]|uniref:CbtA family protein n=1 Tax=Amycolatopsis sp. GM8 TaxID=2896530 RepID=UPI001F18E29D|nr:CbtA family protein [Amycolatopsis sp. GM8]
MGRNLVFRGMLAGALAGLLTFVFSRIFAEPSIEAAIGYESGRDAALSTVDSVGMHDEGVELFSRTVQGTFGLGVGVILFGLAMGTLAGVVFTVALGRVGRIRPRVLALLVASAGLLVFFLVPFVKYPANPPSVGHPDTIGSRTTCYLLAIVITGIALGGAVWLGRRLAPRLGNWNASLVAGAAFVVVTGVVLALLPSFAEVPGPARSADGAIVYPAFPADVLAAFRLSTVAGQLVLWASFGLVFGPLAERVLARGRAAELIREESVDGRFASS